MAALLKSADSKEFVGSNPTLSARGRPRLDADGGAAALRASLTHHRVRSLRSHGMSILITLAA